MTNTEAPFSVGQPLRFTPNGVCGRAVSLYPPAVARVGEDPEWTVVLHVPGDGHTRPLRASLLVPAP